MDWNIYVLVIVLRTQTHTHTHTHTHTRHDDGLSWNPLSILTLRSTRLQPPILVRQILSSSSLVLALFFSPALKSLKPAGKTPIICKQACASLSTHTHTHTHLLNIRQGVVFWDSLMYLCIWLLLNNTSLFVIFPVYTLGVMERSGNKSRVVLKTRG